MKRQIRQGVFETNSSSTHAMAVQTCPNVMYGIYANLSDEVIETHNNSDEVKEGWQCKLIKKEDLPSIITFYEGEFGWEIRTIKPDDYVTKASYLYTMMSELLSYEEFDEAVKRIEKWLKEEGIAAEFQPYEKINKIHMNEYKCLPSMVKLIRENEHDWGYVDHADGAEDFVLYVISRKNNLFNYLFGDSFIKTGNDNVDCDVSLCTEDEHWPFDCTHKKFYKGN
jgi:hypothetical protein